MKPGLGIDVREFGGSKSAPHEVRTGLESRVQPGPSRASLVGPLAPPVEGPGERGRGSGVDARHWVDDRSRRPERADCRLPHAVRCASLNDRRRSMGGQSSAGLRPSRCWLRSDVPDEGRAIQRCVSTPPGARRCSRIGPVADPREAWPALGLARSNPGRNDPGRDGRPGGPGLGSRAPRALRARADRPSPVTAHPHLLSSRGDPSPGGARGAPWWEFRPGEVAPPVHVTDVTDPAPRDQAAA